MTVLRSPGHAPYLRLPAPIAWPSINRGMDWGVCAWSTTGKTVRGDHALWGGRLRDGMQPELCRQLFRFLVRKTVLGEEKSSSFFKATKTQWLVLAVDKSGHRHSHKQSSFVIPLVRDFPFLRHTTTVSIQLHLMAYGSACRCFTGRSFEHDSPLAHYRARATSAQAPDYGEPWQQSM